MLEGCAMKMVSSEGELHSPSTFESATHWALSRWDEAFSSFGCPKPLLLERWSSWLQEQKATPWLLMLWFLLRVDAPSDWIRECDLLRKQVIRRQIENVVRYDWIRNSSADVWRVNRLWVSWTPKPVRLCWIAHSLLVTRCFSSMRNLILFSIFVTVRMTPLYSYLCKCAAISWIISCWAHGRILSYTVWRWVLSYCSHGSAGFSVDSFCDCAWMKQKLILFFGNWMIVNTRRF